MNPVFLYYISRSDVIVNQPVTDADVFGVQIPLSSLAEQRRIVAHLEEVQEKIRALRAAQAETDEELKRLEQAILDKAFRGEL